MQRLKPLDDEVALGRVLVEVHEHRVDGGPCDRAQNGNRLGGHFFGDHDAKSAGDDSVLSSPHFPARHHAVHRRF